MPYEHKGRVNNAYLLCIIVTDFCVLLLLIFVHACYRFLCTRDFRLHKACLHGGIIPKCMEGILSDARVEEVVKRHRETTDSEVAKMSLHTKYTHISSRQLAENRVFQKHPTIVEMTAKIAFSEGWVADF